MIRPAKDSIDWAHFRERVFLFNLIVCLALEVYLIASLTQLL